MVSRSSAPHSIRFKNELWGRVVVFAAVRDVTPNEAVVTLLEAGLVATQMVSPGIKWREGPALTRDPAKPVTLNLGAEITVADKLHFPKAAPGSRLKGTKK